jgi:hypothetical protein
MREFLGVCVVAFIIAIGAALVINTVVPGSSATAFS